MATQSGSDDINTRTQHSPLASQRGNYQPPTVPSGHPPATRGWFPLGYKEAASQWWAGLAPASTEHSVLSFVPYLQKPPTHTITGSAPGSATASSANLQSSNNTSPVTTTSSITDPYGPRRWVSQMVNLSGKDRALNEFSVERVGEDVEHNLVMLHGYGAGLGFFYKNFEGLSRAPGWKLYALDMLGMGRSSRPPFRICAKTREEKITEAENWFIDALEEWRIKKNINKFTLLGHSLGGYMAVAYALKYPGHLNKLILASPVGIPEDPFAVNAEMPEPSQSTIDNEFTQDQNSTANSSSSKTQDKPPRKPMPKWLTTLWDANISPFSFVRWAGPIGPRLVSGWTSRRFSHLPEDEARALHDYAYSLFRQRGSGEYALAYILAPGAFARSPLIRRIQGVGRQYLGVHAAPLPDSSASSSIQSPGSSTNPQNNTLSASSSPRETGLPVVLMYGEHDWMDVAGGFAAEMKLNAETSKVLATADPETRKSDNGSAKVVVIRKAGHHVYLDGWEQFNEVMREEMADVEKREKGWRP
ncbi:alpha/beta-hydrolase [Pseudovirgaria hyperparasitica]|uniref:Alpha/beta-hydrolase n=1 Tax=Pseudovirgaria hyperparasitica TaxID=470096 RepID=A0A6A6WJW2_9PEZI|nr:alpha/beta-hydrolase [Pseudovirgaria hyperparasitica]KAF2762257.1 alpha/beta-hydrolase [Pseudovirgaria hyperparasitica]